MNRIFRSIWSEKHGAYVAAAENTKSRGKSASSVASVIVSCALISQGAVAQSNPNLVLPTGGVVQTGSASISTNGNTLQVVQDSQRSVIIAPAH